MVPALICCAFASLFLVTSSTAEESWNPFANRQSEPAPAATRVERSRRLEPFQPGERPWQEQGRPAAAGRTPYSRNAATDRGGYLPPAVPGAPVFRDDDVAVERRELAPLVPAPGASRPGVDGPGPAVDGTGSTAIAGSIDPVRFEKLVVSAPLPPASPTLRRLWRGIVAEGGPLSGDDQRLRALQLAALHRSALYVGADAVTAGTTGGSDSLVMALAARNSVLAGNEDGCGQLRDGLSDAARLPDGLRGELLVLGGYCAVKSGNAAGATLAAQLARESGFNRAETLARLEALAEAGVRPGVAEDGRIGAIDVRLLQARDALGEEAVPAATAPALAIVATDADVPPVLRIVAAERAAVLGAIGDRDLLDAYASAAALRLSDPQTPGTQRAMLLRAIQQQRAYFQRSRDIRAFLDSARRDGFYLHALRLVAEPAGQLPRIPEIGWFAQTAVEVALASGDTAQALEWIDFASRLDPGNRAELGHWRVLADIADPDYRDRGRDLVLLERLAMQRQFQADELHLLATVLDALNYNVPIGLWNAANATPQPTGGHLPPTGTLRELADTAKARQIAETVLLVMTTIGPGGPNKANLLALGDSIRGLMRAGLEPDARRLAFEVLLPIWPRTSPR